MANNYKTPAQLKPDANVLTDLYIVPANTQAVTSNMHVCNIGTTDANIRIAIRPNGATLSDVHYLFYDLTIVPRDTTQLGDGITMGAADVISVSSSTGEVVFNLSYAEVS